MLEKLSQGQAHATEGIVVTHLEVAGVLEVKADPERAVVAVDDLGGKNLWRRSIALAQVLLDVRLQGHATRLHRVAQRIAASDRDGDPLACEPTPPFSDPGPA